MIDPHTRSLSQINTIQTGHHPASCRSTTQRLNIHKDLPTTPSLRKEVDPCFFSGVVAFSRLSRTTQHFEEANEPTSQVDSRATTPTVCSLAESWSDLATCSEGCSSTDGDSEVSSFLPPTPTIRRFFARELNVARVSSGNDIVMRVNQDGLFPCPRRGCCDVLPTLKAFACHVHIHLIHDV